MINVTINAKGLDPKVKYSRPVKRLVSPEEEVILSLGKQLAEEVLENSSTVQQRKQVKQLKRFLKTAAVVSFSALKAAPASVAVAATTTPALTGVTANPITPALIMKVGLVIGGLTVAAGIGIAMVCLGMAGISRMFRQRQFAQEWTTDVVKGLVQVLISIPVVFVILLVAQWVFKNLPAIGNIF
jgi:hypothetical protein